MRSAAAMFTLLSLLSFVPAIAAVPPVFEKSWGSLGEGVGEFNSPTGIAIGSSGQIYVTDYGNYRIQKFAADGTFLYSWGDSGSTEGEFDRPQGLCLAPSGFLFVADIFNHRIQVFSPDSSYLRAWGSQGSGDGEFNVPRDVAVGLDGSIYVADAGNNRIQRFTQQGNFLAKWGSFGSATGEFSGPHHLTVGPGGNVYVSEAYNNRVQKFDSTGVFLMAFGENGSGDGQFINPRDLDLDGAGNIYVPDLGNHRVQVFDTNGDLLSILGGPDAGSEEGEFIYPEAVAVDDRGNVYVVDSDIHRIQKFAPLPLIESIADIAGDQGGRVRLDITASSQDIASPVAPILQYEVFRRIEPVARAGRAVEGAAPAGMLSDQSVLASGWEFVGAVPAHVEDEYFAVVPTLVDSTMEDGPNYSHFFIRAATANPGTFFDSPVDSGYSIDNLEPNVPQDFVVESISPDGDVALNWSPSGASDFRFYSVHRGLERDFEPDESTLIARTTESGYVDEGAAPGGLLFYYKLSATDFAGNESGFALASTGVVAVRSGAPLAYALHAATPNPLRDAASLGFDLPVSTTVSLRIHDARGRIIRHALDTTLPAGRHSWSWDRRDDAGRRVPAGMYFYSISTPGFRATQKAVVLE